MLSKARQPCFEVLFGVNGQQEYDIVESFSQYMLNLYMRL